MISTINGFFKLMYSPYGKIGRLQFIFGCFAALGLYFLYCVITGFIVGVVIGALNPMGNPVADQVHANTLMHDVVADYTIPVYMLMMVAHYVILFMKRIRDVGATPWYSLVLIVPLLNLIVSFILFFCPGKSTDTKVVVNAV